MGKRPHEIVGGTVNWSWRSDRGRRSIPTVFSMFIVRPRADRVVARMSKELDTASHAAAGVGREEYSVMSSAKDGKREPFLSAMLGRSAT